MSSIPLGLQRRFEQRWAARFASAAPQKQRLERQRQQSAAISKSKRKTRRPEAEILTSRIAVLGKWTASDGRLSCGKRP